MFVAMRMRSTPPAMRMERTEHSAAKEEKPDGGRD